MGAQHVQNEVLADDGHGHSRMAVASNLGWSWFVPCCDGRASVVIILAPRPWIFQLVPILRQVTSAGRRRRRCLLGCGFKLYLRRLQLFGRALAILLDIVATAEANDEHNHDEKQQNAARA